METTPVWVGIDVAKAQLDIALGAEGETTSLTNDEAGIETLLTTLRDRTCELVVLEATGGYEVPVVSEKHKSRVSQHDLDTIVGPGCECAAIGPVGLVEGCIDGNPVIFVPDLEHRIPAGDGVVGGSLNHSAAGSTH